MSFLSDDLLSQLLSSYIKIHVCVVANTLFTILFTNYYNETVPKDKQLSRGTLPIMEKEERVISSTTSQGYRLLSLISPEQTWEIGSARLKFNEKRGTRAMDVLPYE